MDFEESHITTFVRMTPWGIKSWMKEGTALQLFLRHDPRHGGETRKSGHKRHVWKMPIKGQKPLYGVMRPAFPPGPIGDLLGSALGEWDADSC